MGWNKCDETAVPLRPKGDKYMPEENKEFALKRVSDSPQLTRKNNDKTHKKFDTPDDPTYSPRSPPKTPGLTKLQIPQNSLQAKPKSTMTKKTLNLAKKVVDRVAQPLFKSKSSSK